MLSKWKRHPSILILFSRASHPGRLKKELESGLILENTLILEEVTEGLNSLMPLLLRELNELKELRVVSLVEENIDD